MNNFEAFLVAIIRTDQSMAQHPHVRYVFIASSRHLTITTSKECFAILHEVHNEPSFEAARNRMIKEIENHPCLQWLKQGYFIP